LRHWRLHGYHVHPLRAAKDGVRASAIPRRHRPAHRAADLPGLLGAVAETTDHVDQPLWAERDGPTGAQLPQAEHAGLSVQIRGGRGRRYIEKRNDSMVRATVSATTTG